MNLRRLGLLAASAALLLTGSGIAAQEDGPLAFEARWSPDGRWIGVGSNDGAWIFEADDLSAEPLRFFEDDSVYVVAFDPVRPYAAFAPGEGEAVHVLDLETGEEVFTAEVPPNPEEDSFSVFYDLDYSPDGSLLAVVNASMIYVLDAETGAEQHSFFNGGFFADYGSDPWITSVSFFRNETLYATNWNGELLYFDLTTGATDRWPLDIEHGAQQVEALLFANQVLFKTSDIVVHNTENNTDRRILLNQRTAYSLSLTSDQALMAVGSDAEWLLVNFDTSRVIETFSSPAVDAERPPRIHSIAFSPGSDRVLTLQTDGPMRMWDIVSGEMLDEWTGFSAGVNQRWG